MVSHIMKKIYIILFHRLYDYLFFADRIEIISPEHLPNNLTVGNIKAGNSVCRNPIIASFASNLLLYSGIGTGIRRALKMHPSIEFIDDRNGNLFKVIIWYDAEYGSPKS